MNNMRLVDLILGLPTEDPGDCDQPEFSLFRHASSDDDDAEYGSSYTQSFTKWLRDLGRPDWEHTVQRGAFNTCRLLGLVNPAYMRNWLENVSIVQGSNRYMFDITSQKPVGSFATMTVVLIPARKDVKVTVTHEAMSEQVPHEYTAEDSLVYVTHISDCGGAVHVCGDSYATMHYHLYFPAESPAKFKDQAWYLEQLAMIAMERQDVTEHCWLYILDDKSTMNASGNVQPAVTRLREVTEALKAAHQQGLLEVFKATVTHLCEVPTSHYRQPLVTMSIDKWKSLAGKDPGFDKIRMTEHDSIFVPGSRTQSGYRQASPRHWLKSLKLDSFTIYESSRPETLGKLASGSVTSRQALVVWPSKSHWAVFCRQGLAPAFNQLKQMLAPPMQLHSITDSIASATTPIPLPHTAHAITTSTDATKIARLISAMCDAFRLRELKDLAVPGFDSFYQMAVAFGVSKYIALVEQEQEQLKQRLRSWFEDQVLDVATAKDMVKAAQELEWSCVTPAYDALAQHCIPYTTEPRCVLDSFKALKLLLEQADTGLQPAVAASVLQLANSLQRQSLPAELEASLHRKAFSTYMSPLLPQEPVTIFTTQKWMASSDDKVDDVSCNLIQLAMEMLDSLLHSSHQYGVSQITVEEVACGAVDALLQSPRHFHMSQVVAPACAALHSASGLCERLTGSSAMIKLAAGCLCQLHHMAQIQAGLAACSACPCQHCIDMQAFLTDSSQHKWVATQSKQQAKHTAMCSM